MGQIPSQPAPQKTIHWSSSCNTQKPSAVSYIAFITVMISMWSGLGSADDVVYSHACTAKAMYELMLKWRTHPLNNRTQNCSFSKILVILYYWALNNTYLDAVIQLNMLTDWKDAEESFMDIQTSRGSLFFKHQTGSPSETTTKSGCHFSRFLPNHAL